MTLRYASYDLMGLIIEAAERRMPLIMGRRAAKGAGTLELSKVEHDRATLLRLLHTSMMRQDKAGGHQVDDSVLPAFRDALQWLLSEHCRLNNYPDKTLEYFPDSALLSSTPAEPGSYGRIRSQILAGV